MVPGEPAKPAADDAAPTVWTELGRAGRLLALMLLGLTLVTVGVLVWWAVRG